MIPGKKNPTKFRQAAANCFHRKANVFTLNEMLFDIEDVLQAIWFEREEVRSMESYKKHLEVESMRYRAKLLIPIQPTHAREVIAWMVSEFDRLATECGDLDAKHNINVLL